MDYSTWTRAWDSGKWRICQGESRLCRLPLMADPASIPNFTFPLGEQSPRTLQGGIAAEASVVEFPISKNIAGVFMKLIPGGLRELHWHANAAEWAYMIDGEAQVTVFDPSGAWETLDFAPGDIWYFPKGHGHSIQGMGGKECTFILVFDNGAFSEFATFSLTDWLAHTPPDIVSKNLHLSSEDVAQLPKGEVYIATGPSPAMVSDHRSSDDTPPLTHKFCLRSQAPRTFEGGTMRIVSETEFPISTTMTGALLTLRPGAFRAMHWHPNADEWQYIVKGNARLSVFASSGMASTVDMKAGDVGYIPMGFGHAIENVGDGEMEMIIVLNNGQYQEISASAWLASQPTQLLATNLGVSEEIVNRIPKTSKLIRD